MTIEEMKNLTSGFESKSFSRPICFQQNDVATPALVLQQLYVYTHFFSQKKKIVFQIVHETPILEKQQKMCHYLK